MIETNLGPNIQGQHFHEQNIQIYPFFRKLVHYTILSNKTSAYIKLFNYKNIPKY
jgi:hypothetical protein